MKEQTRKGVFETNSSSVHTITISKKGYDKSIIPEVLVFTFGEFGWEVDKLSSVYEKASYLYTSLNNVEDRDEKIEFIKNTLKSVGCTAAFAEKKETHSYFENGYIDHAEDLGEFIDVVFENENALLNYLFGDGCIYTYNDNMDYDNMEYSDEIYWLENNEYKKITELSLLVL